MTALFGIMALMAVDNTWIDMRHGMSLHPGPWEKRDNENGVLFYLENIMIKEARGDAIMDDLFAFGQIVDSIRTRDHNNAKIMGLFDRGQDESKNPDREAIRTISHDNLTAIAAFDCRYGSGEEAEHIANFGFARLLRYDNAYPYDPRIITIQWPTDWAFWASCSNKSKEWAPYWVPLYPLFLLRCFLANLSEREDTSGKLLNFVRFYATKDRSWFSKMVWKTHVAMMKWKYGDNWLHEIMKIYFHNELHPNRVLTERKVL